jgi:hypothetical protein
MRKIILAVSAIAIILVINACKKSDSATSNAKTVQNLSGTYGITAISVTASGLTIDEFATLVACEKDNLIILKTDLTLTYNDAGVVCTPSEEATGTWSLSSNSDTLKVSGIPSFPTGINGYIKSWDGKTMVLTSAQTANGIPTTASITMLKK